MHAATGAVGPLVAQSVRRTNSLPSLARDGGLAKSAEVWGAGDDALAAHSHAALPAAAGRGLVASSPARRRHWGVAGRLRLLAWARCLPAASAAAQYVHSRPCMHKGRPHGTPTARSRVLAALLCASLLACCPCYCRWRHPLLPARAAMSRCPRRHCCRPSARCLTWSWTPSALAATPRWSAAGVSRHLPTTAARGRRRCSSRSCSCAGAPRP